MMLSLIGFHLGRAFTRALIGLMLLPAALAEFLAGVALLDAAGSSAIGLLPGLSFVSTGVILVILHHCAGRWIDRIGFSPTRRRRLSRETPYLRAFIPA